MQDDKDLPDTAKPEGEQNQSTGGGLVAVHEKEREKDNRAEAFRALKKAGRGKRR